MTTEIGKDDPVYRNAMCEFYDGAAARSPPTSMPAASSR
jgi:hypothetical protein